MLSKIILVSSFLFLLIILFLTIILITKYTKLLIKYTNLKKYIYNYLNLITSARYGNLNSKCEKGTTELTKQLSKNTNALFESVFDRDKMIKEYIEKEKQSQSLKQDFISTLAHDLKVPIIAQDNTYDLFLNGNFGEITQTQKHAIENLKISNNDLKNLVIDLLDAHKIDNQELKPNFELTNLNSLIQETINQNSSILKIQNKNLTFIQNETIELKLDPYLIKRALNNLISNAIYYSKNEKNIQIILSKKKNFVEISVKDEGRGIKENEINEIFKKYYTSQKKYSNIGIGLGLYIVKRIVQAHQGQIKAKNNKDKGACFTIILPLN